MWITSWISAIAAIITVITSILALKKLREIKIETNFIKQKINTVGGNAIMNNRIDNTGGDAIRVESKQKNA